MNDALIWLHEDALRASHPIFATAPSHCEVAFIWDDAYLRAANYSLKRLVFLYETLCELPIVILRGDALEILSNHEAKQLYVPTSPNPWIQSVCERVAENKTVIRVADEPFVRLKTNADFRRFFQYWSRAEKSALLRNGLADA
jgi:hypothetical protein